MKMIIDGSCDIGFWCLNLELEGNESSYDIELRNHDFKNQVERHEEKSYFEEAVDKSFSINESVHRCLV